MKKALVIGATGGMGYSVVRELVSRGVEVVAFARTEWKLEKLFVQEQKVTLFAGDIFKLEELEKAATGVDVIFQCANIPYSQWEERLELFIGNVLTAAKSKSAKFVSVDNIYAYGRSHGMKVTETAPKNPHTKKGKLRLRMGQLIKESGVPYVIAHFPDFYGPNAENTLLHYTLKSVVANKKAGFVGGQDIPREFIFTPDGAKALVHLALEESAYGQSWNIPGVGVIKGIEIVELLREDSRYEGKVSTISKTMIRLLGLFNRDMREMVELFYLNEEPVILDGSKYEQYFGELPRTSYREGLKQTIEYMRRNG